MKLALTYALCSLIFTAFNDLVFKLFANRMRSLGGFVAIVGCIGVASTLIITDPSWGANRQATIAWGVAGGFFSVTANLLLVSSMARQSAGLCSSIYRLNMVFVVAGAWLLLGESISAVQWCGIGCALAAILCFVPMGTAESDGKGKAGFAMAVAACMLRAGMGLAYKHGLNLGADKNSMALITHFAWIIGGVLYIAVKERSMAWTRDANALKYSAVSGLLVSLVVLCMSWSLEAGDASLVLPIAQMSFLATFLLSVVFLHEKCTPRKAAALALGAASIVMLSRGA